MEEEGIYYYFAMAGLGNEHGNMAIPEVNDEVLVGFEHGNFGPSFVNPSRYYQLGSLLRYNSGKTAVDRGYGHGVDSFFDIWVSISLDTVRVSGLAGDDVLTFIWNGSLYDPTDGRYLARQYNPGQYKVTTKHGTAFYFDDPTHHKISSIVDRNGNAPIFNYSAGGWLTTVVCPDNRQINSEYEDDHVVHRSNNNYPFKSHYTGLQYFQ